MNPLHPSLVPETIVAFHRALLSALRVDYFAPGILEMNRWRDFLFVMKPLEDSAGGALKVEEIAAAVVLMRKENRDGANWSLRFAKIMGDPETFRDFVLRSRRVERPREPVRTTSRTDATGALIAVESDPAAEAEAEPVSEGVRRFMAQYREHKAIKNRTERPVPRRTP